MKKSERERKKRKNCEKNKQRMKKFLAKTIGIFLIVNLQVSLFCSALKASDLEMASIENDNANAASQSSNKALGVLLRVLIEQSVANRLNQLYRDELPSSRKHALADNDYFVK